VNPTPPLGTHIHVLLDRSGSMDSLRDDAIGGFNDFVRRQREVEGRCTLSLVQFDSQDPQELVIPACDIHEVPLLDAEQFVPRGGTPLLDAMGRSIHDLSRSLALMAASARPDQVVMVVLTDGQENSSREFTRARLARLVHRQERRGWRFLYLAADFTAFADAQAFGFRADASLRVGKRGDAVREAMTAASDLVCCVRLTPHAAPRFSPAQRRRTFDASQDE
jgi:hypothetical protein